MCIKQIQNVMVTTKINVIPEVDQRFNLTRWSKLEKDSDFPLCFAARKAEFFFLSSFVREAEIRPSPENEQVWSFEACLLIL